MGEKLFVKISMPSAPAAGMAPYVSQTIGMTTWHEPVAIDGITYLPGLLLQVGGFASSGDASAGKGGFAPGCQGDSLEILDLLADDSRLYPRVMSGEIPLVGATVTIVDATGRETTQSWRLHDPQMSVGGISFVLRTPGYLDMRPLAFPATNADGAVSVGVAVGDPAVVGVGATGPGSRYKGVNVPTKSASTFEPITTSDITPWNFGNPNNAITKIPNTKVIATRAVSTDFSSLTGEPLWPSMRNAFEFRFLSLQGLTDFVSKYIGVTWNTVVGGGTANKVAPSTIFAISDGSNLEVITKSDTNGDVIVTQEGGWIPLQGDATDCVAADSMGVAAPSGSPKLLWGTGDGRIPFNYAATGKFYYETGFLLFIVCEKPQTIDGVTFYALYVSPRPDGSLYGASASSVYLCVSSPKNAVCVGANSLVGFGSKSSSSNESGIVSVNGVIDTKNGVLSFLPTSIFDGKFSSWTDLPVAGCVAMYASVVSGDGSASISFDGNISDISNVALGTNGWYMRGTFAFGANGGPGYPSYHWTWKYDIPKKLPNFSIDKVFVDWRMEFQIINNSASTFKPKAMAPFFPNEFSAPQAKPAYANYAVIPFFGKGFGCAARTFPSLEALNGTPAGSKGGLETAVEVANAAVERSFQQRFCELHIYAITNISFGSNPAVVVPGNWPGTSNPTTTPKLAADQLAAWIFGTGKTVSTGGITPSASTWGRYLGPDVTSSEQDTTAAKQRLSDLDDEGWIWRTEATGAPIAPTIESVEAPTLEAGSIDNVVTLLSIDYDPAGTSAQFTATTANVDQPFDPANGDGHYWSGWQEKDICHFLTNPGSAVLAMCQMEDCLAIVCADGYLRCSYDGGVTWPFSRLLASNPVGSVAIAGNGVMVASAGGNLATVVSFDAGRTWEAISITLAAFRGGWFDETTGRLWLCGADASSSWAVWYSLDGMTWEKMVVVNGYSAPSSVVAHGDHVLVSARFSSSDNRWYALVSTISGESWAAPHVGDGTGFASEPSLSFWDSKFRVATSDTLYSSTDLSSWPSVPVPTQLSAFATDGKVVAALASESSGGNHVYYSRDQGTTWKGVQVSPEGTTWTAAGSKIAIWDDNAYCFRFSAWGPDRILALGDPSVLDIWHQCRDAYLATGTMAKDSRSWLGLYDADEVVRWLLDCKDGIDPAYEQPRLTHMTKQAQYLTCTVMYPSLVDQLSVTAFQTITVPRQRIQDAGLDANIPSVGLITQVHHESPTGENAGKSTLQIMFPPL